MSRPRNYGGDKSQSLEELETWISQTEDFSGEITAITANATKGMTVGTFDCDIPKPGTKARVQLLIGDQAVADGVKFKGKAYVDGQIMKVAVFREA